MTFNQARQKIRSRLQHSLHHTAFFHKIASLFTPPMVALKKSDGTYVTDPQKMDDLVCSSWATVYAGNVANPMQATAKYLHKYAAYIFKASPFKIAELDPDELRQVVLSCSPSAAGMDTWTYDDWKWLPREAFVQLCVLLTRQDIRGLLNCYTRERPCSRRTQMLLLILLHVGFCLSRQYYIEYGPNYGCCTCKPG